ncbi:MAG: hypothetical protein U0Y08_14920 [Bacteroidia bacterium]
MDSVNYNINRNIDTIVYSYFNEQNVQLVDKVKDTFNWSPVIAVLTFFGGVFATYIASKRKEFNRLHELKDFYSSWLLRIAEQLNLDAFYFKRNIEYITKRLPFSLYPNTDVSFPFDKIQSIPEVDQYKIFVRYLIGETRNKSIVLFEIDSRIESVKVVTENHKIKLQEIKEKYVLMSDQFTNDYTAMKLFKSSSEFEYYSESEELGAEFTRLYFEVIKWIGEFKYVIGSANESTSIKLNELRNIIFKIGAGSIINNRNNHLLTLINNFTSRIEWLNLEKSSWVYYYSKIYANYHSNAYRFLCISHYLSNNKLQGEKYFKISSKSTYRKHQYSTDDLKRDLELIDNELYFEISANDEDGIYYYAKCNSEILLAVQQRNKKGLMNFDMP